MGQIITRLREKAGLTLTQLAEKAGLSLAYISKLESGEYQTISLATSQSLAQGLSLSLRDFLSALGLLGDSNRPSMDMVQHALRNNGYSAKQADTIIKYAKFLKNPKNN